MARGTAQAALERDFTVKVDAGNLKPGATLLLRLRHRRRAVTHRTHQDASQSAERSGCALDR